MNMIPDFATIKNAHKRIKPYIHKTPVFTNHAFNKLTGHDIYFKCENFQKVGAFKARGALNAVLSLNKEQVRHGVVTHSSGNHAQALALAAQTVGVPAYIVMPSNAPDVKKNAVEGYGGKITFCEPTLEARETTAAKVMHEVGGVYVHPYDNYAIIAGAGTAALELLDEVNDLDIVIAPVGGGGLISGTALAAFHTNNKIKVIAGEPEKANDAYLSYTSGKLTKIPTPKTIADGLRTMLCEKTFGIIRDYVHDIVTVSEEEIIASMKYVWERMKVVIEPSSAVPVAAVQFGKVNTQRRKIGIILSGGNVDLSDLPF